MVLKLRSPVYFPARPIRPMIAPTIHVPVKDVYNVFWQNIRAKRPDQVLEVGTRRSSEDRSTHNRNDFPWVAPGNYVRLDIQEGIDVDVVGDLHNLPGDWEGRFDCVIADAVFEHLERPWIAAKEIARVMSPGASFLVVTHQCYPIHGHPNDFFRFSQNALRILLEDAGLVLDVCEYSDRCLIVPPEHIVPYDILQSWNEEFPSYAMVKATGRKPL